jgi:hypothetical protein
MSPLQQSKLWVMGFSGLSKDALHVYVGLAVFFGCALMFRWPLQKGGPLLAVLVAALAGEIWDLADTLRYGEILRLSGNWHDVWNTLFWPLVITLIARMRLLKTGL